MFSGAFLIPYAICLVTSGLPVFLLELGLGQYMNTGSIGAWRIVPGLQGKSMEFWRSVLMWKHGWIQKYLIRGGERVLKTYFLLINVFHRGPYEPPSRRNRTHGVKLLLQGDPTSISKEAFNHL